MSGPVPDEVIELLGEIISAEDFGRDWEPGVETRAREDGGRWVVEQRDVLRGPWREVTT